MDTGKRRPTARDSALKPANIETSISKFVNQPSDSHKREWTIKERPDEMLKRYLRSKRKEQKLQATLNQQHDGCEQKSVVSGCFEMTPRRDIAQKLQTPKLSHLSKDVMFHKTNLSKEYIENLKQKVGEITLKMKNSKKSSKPSLFSALKPMHRRDLTLEPELEYNGQVMKELEDIKRAIDFDLDTLKQQYA